jgi:feruloyl-CoA synthase
MTGLGMTETSPSCTFGTGDIIKAGYVGVPAPGCKVKLVPSGDKLEARFHGPHVTPGYWRAPLLTAEAFDSEGYYCTGDALRFYDPIARNWASCSTAASPKTSSSIPAPSSVGRCGRASSARRRHVMDVVVTGIDRHAIGLLVFPRMEHCHPLSGLGRRSQRRGSAFERTCTRAFPKPPERLERRCQRFLHAHRPFAAASSRAVDRSSRTDGQRLHQSGGGATRRAPSLHRFRKSSDPDVIIVHKTKQQETI